MEIRPIEPGDRETLARQFRELWAGPAVVSRGRVFDASLLPGFVAVEGGEIVGSATYHVEGDRCELVTLESAAARGKGTGTALCAAVRAAATAAGCRDLWLVTTNDNAAAIRFYLRRGFQLRDIHIGAMEKSRELKPGIPLTGDDGVPILHELEFGMAL